MIKSTYLLSLYLPANISVSTSSSSNSRSAVVVTTDEDGPWDEVGTLLALGLGGSTDFCCSCIQICDYAVICLLIKVKSGKGFRQDKMFLLN